MREKIINILFIFIVFFSGLFVSKVFLKDSKSTPVISNNNCSGVVKCSNNVKIDETGISTSVGKIYDATVTIQNYKNNKVNASGSGFVYKKDSKYAYILTNHHVIDGSDKLMVTNSDDQVFEGTLLGSDQYLDLAVFRVDKDNVKQVATLGNSEETNLGDTIFTVGTPISYEYRGTVTKGTLSGKNRMVSVSVKTNDDWIMKVLQVDAAINPGNSGGPLLNVNGEVIGINSLKLAQNEIEGMGFAIPIEYAISFTDQLEKGEKIERPLIGISMANISDAFLLYQQGLMIDKELTSGVVIINIVDKTAAASAGLKRGDVITKIGDRDVKNAAYLKYELFQYKPGDKVEITYIRNKEEKKATLTLTKSD